MDPKKIKVREEAYSVIRSQKTGEYINFLSGEEPKTGDEFIYLLGDKEKFFDVFKIKIEKFIVIVHKKDLKAICSIRENENWYVKGSLLVVSGPDRTMMWNTTDGNIIIEIKDETNWTIKGSNIVLIDSDNNTKVVDKETGTIIEEY
jgi:hypothetical protein